VTTPNFHDDEIETIIGYSSDTKAVLDEIFDSLGNRGKTTFITLKQALDNTLTRLLRLQQDLLNKKQALPTNNGIGNSSPVKIPNLNVPKLSLITGTINSILGTHTSSDIAEMHSAISASNALRSSADITDFELQKIKRVGGKIDAQLNAIMKYRDRINTIKALVETYI